MPDTPRKRVQPSRASGKPRKRGEITTSEYEHTDDESEFLRAIEAFKARTRKRFPTWSDALAVLRSLGYRKEGGT